MRRYRSLRAAIGIGLLALVAIMSLPFEASAAGKLLGSADLTFKESGVLDGHLRHTFNGSGHFARIGATGNLAAFVFVDGIDCVIRVELNVFSEHNGRTLTVDSGDISPLCPGGPFPLQLSISVAGHLFDNGFSIDQPVAGTVTLTLNSADVDSDLTEIATSLDVQ